MAEFKEPFCVISRLILQEAPEESMDSYVWKLHVKEYRKVGKGKYKGEFSGKSPRMCIDFSNSEMYGFLEIMLEEKDLSVRENMHEILERFCVSNRISVVTKNKLSKKEKRELVRFLKHFQGVVCADLDLDVTSTDLYGYNPVTRDIKIG